MGANPLARAMVVLLVACLAGPVSGHAVEEDRLLAEFVGKDRVNGRSWEKLGYAGKLGFVCGIFDGATLIWSMTGGDRSKKRGEAAAEYESLSVPSETTVGDVVKGMDEFYMEEENLDLPAICAYIYFIRKVRHSGRESMEKRLNVWRKMFRE